MAISMHYTSEDFGASATAYLKDEYTDKRWATVKVMHDYQEVVALFLSEQTVRAMASHLARVVAEFDEQVKLEQAEQD
jgi:hypothetical protein